MKGFIDNMRALVERVKCAKCIIDGEVYSEIKQGFLVYIAFNSKEDIDKTEKMATKIKKLRIFEDENHKLNKSLDDVGGEVLVISSFSLYGDALTGNRPSFTKSLNYIDALPIYGAFTVDMSNLVKTKTGQFGADMLIEAINDGPLSIIIDL